MTVIAAALRELHRIHRQITDLRGRLERGPKQVHAAEVSVQNLGQIFEEAREALTRTRVAADQKQLQLKEREDRIVELKTKLNSCKTNKEFQALKEQIAADEQANSVLSDEILEALEKIDTQQVALGQAEQQLKRAKEELQRTRTKVEEAEAGLRSELERVTSALAVAESQLPAEFREQYQRLAASLGEAALAPIDGECCGSCYTQLTTQTINELQLGQLVFCKSCGVVLYLPENQGQAN